MVELINVSFNEYFLMRSLIKIFRKQKQVYSSSTLKLVKFK